ncbi:MAG: hypothetical protein A3I68_08255 [Candidatus Melainabacteria bacterium RIFCSPLOWO2_02_FULL_35_15]|nr:MAG: hypothetical protein A3F80_08480 [Candidatus Melainabacteria bacterium RIFCSPLOWO2_12_FULL_35_11]OGI13968.1 MAG: hypothetical protein A3I68_08255 [Candidatus Melainabacteria bacterium RIFCSPLOWO2_02_FULL_35_15]
MNTKKHIPFIKVASILILNLFFIFIFCLPNLSSDSNKDKHNIIQRVETQPSDVPVFHAPVCLLVGLNSTELAYREISSLAGFELFSVPYRTDIKTLIEQINPTQVIIKHPSGFVGLYATDGQLIRGVQIIRNNEEFANGQGTPSSIIQPTEGNPMYETVFYPGSVTGAVPHGGLGYVTPPKGRGVARHFLKLASLLGLTPFQYPGYFMAYNTYDKEKLFPALFLPQVPVAIGAAATYADARLDSGEYETARTQPRDYMFQPIIEGY